MKERRRGDAGRQAGRQATKLPGVAKRLQLFFQLVPVVEHDAYIRCLLISVPLFPLAFSKAREPTRVGEPTSGSSSHGRRVVDLTATPIESVPRKSKATTFRVYP